MPLSIHILTAPRDQAGIGLASWADDDASVGLQWTTAEHGFESCVVRKTTTLAGALRWHNIARGWVEIAWNALVMWEGRIEQVYVAEDGGDGIPSVEITAYGAWRALSDCLYTGLISDTSVADWQVGTEERTDRNPELYEMDNNNRIYIGLQKDTMYTLGTDVGEWLYRVPSRSWRNISYVEASYAVRLPSGFQARLTAEGSTIGDTVTVSAIIANGGVQTGTVATVVNPSKPTLRWTVQKATLTSTSYPQENGYYYAILTNLRVASVSPPIYPSVLIRHLATVVLAHNPDQLNPRLDQVQQGDIDLLDVLYEDANILDIVRDMASYGDVGLRQWRLQVWEDRVVQFKPAAEMGRTWYVDKLPSFGRPLEGLGNSVYTTYQDANGTAVRTPDVTSQSSITAFGIKRQRNVQIQTTSAAVATTAAAQDLVDHRWPRSQGDMVVDYVYSASGGRVPAFLVRAGDTLIARNALVGIAPSVENMRSLIVGATAYDNQTRQTTISIEQRPPRLAMYDKRRQTKKIGLATGGD